MAEIEEDNSEFDLIKTCNPIKGGSRYMKVMAVMLKCGEMLTKEQVTTSLV